MKYASVEEGWAVRKESKRIKYLVIILKRLNELND